MVPLALDVPQKFPMPPFPANLVASPLDTAISMTNPALEQPKMFQFCCLCKDYRIHQDAYYLPPTFSTWGSI